MNKDTLPPLPEPTLEDHEYELWGQNVKADFFTSEQVREAQRQAIAAHEPKGAGTAPYRLNRLMGELEKRFPHPKPFDSTKTPEAYALEAIDRLIAEHEANRVQGVPEGWVLERIDDHRIKISWDGGGLVADFTGQSNSLVNGVALYALADAMLSAAKPEPAAPKAPQAETQSKPPGIDALMCVISTLRDAGLFTDEEGELTNELRELRDWAMARATQPPTQQASEQPSAEPEQVVGLDKETQTMKLMGFIDDLIEADPDRAERFIESVLAKAALRKRLETKKAAEPAPQQASAQGEQAQQARSMKCNGQK